MLMSTVKTSSFLPEDVQNSLMYWRDKFKQGYFEVGDIAAEVISAFARDGESVANQEVFREIGVFCGKSSRTVRYYYETAVFYPQAVRDRYSALPFSHFVFARSMGNWQSVLEYAQEHPHMGEDQLRSQFIGVPPCVSDFLAGRPDDGEPEWMQPIVDPVPSPNQKEVDRHRYLQMISNLRESVRTMKEMMERDDLDPGAYEMLVVLTGEIEDRIPGLMETIEFLI